jgi:hypothetical protein
MTCDPVMGNCPTECSPGWRGTHCNIRKYYTWHNRCDRGIVQDGVEHIVIYVSITHDIIVVIGG